MDSKEKSVDKMNKKESISDKLKNVLKADRAEQAAAKSKQDKEASAKAAMKAKKAADKKKFSLKYSGVTKSPLDE